MKILYSFLTMLLFLFPLYFAYAEEGANKEVIHIVTYEEDLTGDGNDELIEVEGTYLSNSSPYYHAVWATITFTTTNEVRQIDFPGGFNPTMQFVDLTNDGTLDILFQSMIDQHKHTYTYALYKLEKDDLVEIPLPKETFVHGRLQDNFLAHLFVTPHHDPIIIDLKEHAHTYIDAGLYDENGILLHQQNVRIRSIEHVQPFLNEQQTNHSLRSIQHVHAPPYQEKLGFIESEWIYQDETWKLLESTWKQ